MDESSDADLILRSLSKPAEFGAIFDRHATTLLRFLTRRAGPDVGAGLLGELFRVAFERRSAFKLEWSSARPWLYGIATNLLMHRRRSDAREAHATRAIENQSLFIGESTGTGTEGSIVEEIDARLLLPNVAMALRLVPEHEREALLLFAWEDLRYEEIAEALDVPIGTVRSRIHRARSRLRELIRTSGKDQYEPPDSAAAREGR